MGLVFVVERFDGEFDCDLAFCGGSEFEFVDLGTDGGGVVDLVEAGPGGFAVDGHFVEVDGVADGETDGPARDLGLGDGFGFVVGDLDDGFEFGFRGRGGSGLEGEGGEGEEGEEEGFHETSYEKDMDAQN